tara:strand:+ start:3036 stop:3173 length:138 start_codon:yes stop_codon:yes gene_type:complete
MNVLSIISVSGRDINDFEPAFNVTNFRFYLYAGQAGPAKIRRGQS